MLDGQSLLSFSGPLLLPLDSLGRGQKLREEATGPEGGVAPFLSPSPWLDNSSLACRLPAEELTSGDLGCFKLVLIVLGCSSWSICR